MQGSKTVDKEAETVKKQRHGQSNEIKEDLVKNEENCTKDNDKGEKHEVAKVIDFHHPYTPYKIQEKFMETVYAVLEAGNGQVGILESPTGTGKSLSLICASMTWLRHFQRRRFEEGLVLGDDATGEPEWVIEQAKARKRRDLLRQREEMETRLAKVRAKEKAQREKYLNEPYAKRRRMEDNTDNRMTEAEEQFVLDEYDSDREGKASAEKGDISSGLTAETLALMEKLGMNVGPARIEEEELEDEVKVLYFYCLVSYLLKSTDLLLFKNAFPTNSIYQRAPACPNTACITTSKPPGKSNPRGRAWEIQTPESRFSKESVHQFVCFQAPLGGRHQ